MPLIRERSSPNHDARPGEREPDLILLHYTGMRSAEEAMARLCAPAARVSAHYCIEEDGTLWRLVPESRRAWHAGLSNWEGQEGVNDRSLGIELVNPGHEWGYRAFPEAQMACLLELLAVLRVRWRIPRWNVVGHADVAPLRKEDPGELFDWARLAAAGHGLWPQEAPALAPDETQARQALATIGYGYLEEDFPAVLRAFQRHFRPARVDGVLDADTAGRLAAVAALFNAARGEG
ncbi:N-acetylmuramoyl-L-alanine amidase [Aquibaculum arenosum]|uniref:N-acetylmuramoyl-L-alanine amidase n=1 Tax=Aquibaculum arenosum TaxID=3032591 RepID=A0ABT5YQU4_9PROT|nr:N-acetylmuramoyl-L-alanine amidase [Fodinicurvata sp. CAU 1616]MDF2097227.1 N-acetylmuramoyl-L-alanine amidase [Fodinicurvata sp. CAU 1616]